MRNRQKKTHLKEKQKHILVHVFSIFEEQKTIETNEEREKRNLN